jgi:hypothetical protein
VDPHLFPVIKKILGQSGRVAVRVFKTKNSPIKTTQSAKGSLAHGRHGFFLSNPAAAFEQRFEKTMYADVFGGDNFSPPGVFGTDDGNDLFLD